MEQYYEQLRSQPAPATACIRHIARSAGRSQDYPFPVIQRLFGGLCRALGVGDFELLWAICAGRKWSRISGDITAAHTGPQCGPEMVDAVCETLVFENGRGQMASWSPCGRQMWHQVRWCRLKPFLRGVKGGVHWALPVPRPIQKVDTQMIIIW